MIITIWYQAKEDITANTLLTTKTLQVVSLTLPEDFGWYFVNQPLSLNNEVVSFGLHQTDMYNAERNRQGQWLIPDEA